MSRLGDFSPLTAPVESVKDQSLFKGQAVSLALCVGHPFYFWAWTTWYPQPYENLPWRVVCSFLGALAFLAIRRYGAADWRAAWSYGLATALGTVVLASWFFVANGGDPVWLASLAGMTLVYFSLTDWRIAVVVTLAAYLMSYLLAPALHVGVWATSSDAQPFNPRDWLVLGFCLAVALLTRYTDTSMRVVQLYSQMRALAVMAHEMRTPLAGMQLLSSALEDRLQVTQPGALAPKELGELRDMSHHLRQRCLETNTLIDTQLANANPFKPFNKRDTVALGKALQNAVATFQLASGVADPLVDVRIKCDFTIQAEETAIQQIIVNLLNNALRAVVQRHKVAAPHSIEAVLECDEGGRLTVSDWGIGIAPSERTKIFEPFYTGDTLYGHGLGLTYVRSAVAAYGGDISVANNARGGASLMITFPKAHVL